VPGGLSLLALLLFSQVQVSADGLFGDITLVAAGASASMIEGVDDSLGQPQRRFELALVRAPSGFGFSRKLFGHSDGWLVKKRMHCAWGV